MYHDRYAIYDHIGMPYITLRAVYIVAAVRWALERLEHVMFWYIFFSIFIFSNTSVKDNLFKWSSELLYVSLLFQVRCQCGVLENSTDPQHTQQKTPVRFSTMSRHQTYRLRLDDKHFEPWLRRNVTTVKFHKTDATESVKFDLITNYNLPVKTTHPSK